MDVERRLEKVGSSGILDILAPLAISTLVQEYFTVFHIDQGFLSKTKI